MKNRYLKNHIMDDLTKKMVFLAGPRQVGKTTLAKQILSEVDRSEYYLWDNREDRQNMLAARWPAEETYLVLDELHKYRKWKNWLKGEYDKHKDNLRILVTGSARMDIYRRGSDSLQGRYHHYRLHPFSINELSNKTTAIKPFSGIEFAPSRNLDNDFELLFTYSGFPEPLIAANSRTHRRWQKERMERFFREDIRDLENIRDLSLMQILTDILPERSSSILSLNSLREDLEVSHRAVTHWIDILDRLYFLFRVKPYTAKTIRGLKKETKVYMWDWTLVHDEGRRFENMVASHLLKFCHFIEDTEGYKIELLYLRDVNKREVDFLVTVDKKPWFAVECKVSDEKISPHLKYFGTRLKIPHLFQVVKESNRDFKMDEIRVIPAKKFLSGFV